MDDLMSKLQNVLNDEESMKQIKELAEMLGNEVGEPEQSSENKAPSDTPLDFSKLIASLGNGTNNPDIKQQEKPENSVDIQKLIQLGTVISSANKSDKNVDLLLALKPMLKEENQIKIDRLIKIFQLFAVYPALKESGLLGGDLFGLL